jgi:CubicO group peptidase (beta-lactamase class C family)
VTSVAKLIPKRAGGYVWNKDKYENAENWPTVRPSGAFQSTVLDMAKWEAALQSNRILKESIKKEMWTPVILNDGRKYPYGFGWELDDWPADSPVPTGVPMIRHEGTIPGFRAAFSRWPSHGLTVIVLTNRQDLNIEGVMANVATRVVPQLRTTPASPR